MAAGRKIIVANVGACAVCAQNLVTVAKDRAFLSVCSARSEFLNPSFPLDIVKECAAKYGLFAATRCTIE
jgi:hypothetical protein